MTLFTKTHYDLLSQFEKEFSHLRLTKEPKELWSKSVVYQDGHANELFLAFRRGHAYGKASTES